MNGTTILLWITIFIIGVIAIILVKLHYKGAELENDEESIIPKDTINGLISYSQEKVSNIPKNNNNTQLTPNIPENNYNIYLEPENEEEKYENLEYESQNQVLINYGNNVEKLQNKNNKNQTDIMTPDNEKTELKDLFTIDELIKESKRKDSEREKESKKIEKDEDLTEIKESIKLRKENKELNDELIEEILADEDIEKILKEEDENEKTTSQSTEPSIQDIIDSSETEETPVENDKPEQDNLEVQETKEKTIENIINDSENNEEESVNENEKEIPLVATQQEIVDAINTATQEIEEEKVEEIISDDENITDVLLNSEETEEEIKEPVLKTPSAKKDDFGAPIDDSNLFNETQEEENDLDYRKDLAKITNTIKGSRIFQDVKEKLKPEEIEEEIDPIADLQENYIRNVNEYDEFEPIINETHDEFGEYYEPDYDEAIRQENTRRLFNNTKNSPEPEIAKPIETIKPKPARDNIKIQINNTETVLKKGDEIIFRHDGETYSSQVYAINGDEISVKYRRQNIKIKPEDIKKIY